jgi:hypothetical protein
MSAKMETEIAITFKRVTCGEHGCGEVFAVPDYVLERWKRTHETWSCPSGHRRAFLGKTNEERRIEDLQRVNRDILAQAEEAWKQAEQLRADLELEANARKAVQGKLSRKKAEVTRIKNRIAGGVCPCCKRTFVSLGRHMKTQHPEYAAPRIRSNLKAKLRPPTGETTSE